MKKITRFSLFAITLTCTLPLGGCSESSGPTVIEQPEKTPEELAAEAAEYEKQMSTSS